jgi:hypothetical protein
MLKCGACFSKMERLKRVVRQIFSEDGGKFSFSRIATAAWMAACVTWISCLFCVKHDLPDGQVFFGMASVCGTLYGANKIGGWFQREQNDNPNG